mmetsp:Transcript_33045/g.68156  ORF Transcript_33045/g.68156 Transcript_33045/m.68156 type:complete len:117 (+) Transcript_33045:153-503(+)
MHDKRQGHHVAPTSDEAKTLAVSPNGKQSQGTHSIGAALKPGMREMLGSLRPFPGQASADVTPHPATQPNIEGPQQRRNLRRFLTGAMSDLRTGMPHASAVAARGITDGASSQIRM